jgi:hypothetical protein
MEQFKNFNAVNSTVNYTLIEYHYSETATETTKTMQIVTKYKI